MIHLYNIPYFLECIFQVKEIILEGGMTFGHMVGKGACIKKRVMVTVCYIYETTNIVDVINSTHAMTTWPRTPAHSDDVQIVFMSSVFWRHWWHVEPWNMHAIISSV